MSEEQKTERKPCLKCLLQEIDPAAYERDVQRLLKAMKPGEKVRDEEYERRLSLCKACERLSNATCSACGCYVEIRAAGVRNHCPYKHW
jgi:hypothetical protein